MDAQSVRLQLSTLPADSHVSADGRVLCSAGELLTLLGGSIEAAPVVKRRLLEYLNIRAAPDVSAGKLGVMPAGAVVGVIDWAVNGYYKIAEQPGYIASNPAWSEVYVAPAPPEPPPVVVGNKIGLHILPGSNEQLLLGTLARTHAAGKPIAGLTLTRMGWDSELKPRDVKRTSPATLVCQRWYDANWEQRPVDWNTADLRAAGRDWVNAYAERFNVKADPEVDYHQVINEPGYGPGTPSFWHGAIEAAQRHGIKLAVGCFAVGNPPLPNESGFWSSFYPVLSLAKSEGHALMLHEYTIPDGSEDWLNEWVMHRYLKVYAAFPPELRDLSLILGEYGQLGLSRVESGYLLDKLRQVQPILANSPQVLFTSLWTFGGGGAWWGDLVDKHLAALEGYWLG